MHTEFKERGQAPRQGAVMPDSQGTAIIHDEFADGLADIEGFSHIWVLFLADRTEGYSLDVTPPGESRPHGLFATRTPNRPNPIGMTLVELAEREGNVLHVRGVDMLDGTPILDIKPYLANIDSRPDTRAGWATGW